MKTKNVLFSLYIVFIFLVISKYWILKNLHQSVSKNKQGQKDQQVESNPINQKKQTIPTKSLSIFSISYTDLYKKYTKWMNMFLVFIFIVLNIYLMFGEPSSLLERINYGISALFFISWFSVVLSSPNYIIKFSYVFYGLAVLLGVSNMIILIGFHDTIDEKLPILLVLLSLWYGRITHVNRDLNSFSYKKSWKS
jgi:hypothetical protein